MPNEMTPLEAAEKLDKLAMSPWSIAWSEKQEGICVADLIRISAFYLRQIAAGEYKPVVHAKSVFVNNGKVERWCSCCNHIIPKYADWCPFCGALMGGKDDGSGR